MLAVWGDCCRRGVRGLGYPSQTAEARLYTSPGRSTRPNRAPDYEPNEMAIRIERALPAVSSKAQLLLWCRYVAEMSDKRLMEFDCDYTTPGKARWAVEKAIKEITVAL